MNIGEKMKSLVCVAVAAFAFFACGDVESGDAVVEMEQDEGSNDGFDDGGSSDDVPGPGEEGFVNTAEIETCLNRDTGFCEVTLVSSAGMDSSGFTCGFESGESVDSCPNEGCLGKCTTDFGPQRLTRYAYEETEGDSEAGCTFLEGSWTTDCSE